MNKKTGLNMGEKNSIVFVLSKYFNIVNLNQRAENVFSWQKEEVLGKNFVKLCKEKHIKCPITVNTAKSLANKTSNVETNINQEIFLRWEINLIQDQSVGYFVLTGYKLA